MSWVILYRRGMLDSTAELNAHFKGLFVPGIYGGFIVTPESGTTLNVSGGVYLDNLGRTLTAETDTVVGPLDTGDLNNDRIDMIALKYDFNSQLGEEPELVVLKGDPAPTPDLPALPANHAMLAYIRVRANTAQIVQQDITLADHIYTNQVYQASVAEPTLHRIYRSRRLSGLQLTTTGLGPGALKITAGEALIGGRYQTLEQDYIMPMPTMPSTLKDFTAADIVAVTQVTSPRLPVKISVTVSLSAVSLTGNVIVVGKDANGDPATETISVRDAASTVNLAVFNSTKVYSSVSSVQLSGFAVGVAKTRVVVKAINKLNIYAQRHGYFQYLPVFYSTQDITSVAVFKLGEVLVDNTTITVRTSTSAALKLLAGCFFQGQFNGNNTGTRIEHNLGIDPASYTVEIMTLGVASDDEKARRIGHVWMDKQADYFIVYNSGSDNTMTFDATLKVGDN